MMTKRRNEKTKKYEAGKMTKTNRINMRLDDSLLTRVDEFANEYGVSRSEVARLTLYGELKRMRPKMDITVEQFDELLNVLKEVDNTFSKYDRYFRSSSTNVNQIAKRLNGGGRLNDEDRKLLERLSNNVDIMRNNLEYFSSSLWEEV